MISRTGSSSPHRCYCKSSYLTEVPAVDARKSEEWSVTNYRVSRRNAAKWTFSGDIRGAFSDISDILFFSYRWWILSCSVWIRRRLKRRDFQMHFRRFKGIFLYFSYSFAFQGSICSHFATTRGGLQPERRMDRLLFTTWRRWKVRWSLLTVAQFRRSAFRLMENIWLRILMVSFLASIKC